MNTQFPRTITLPNGEDYLLHEPHKFMQEDESLRGLVLNINPFDDSVDTNDPKVWDLGDFWMLFQVPYAGEDVVCAIYKEIFGEELKVVGERIPYEEPEDTLEEIEETLTAEDFIY